MQMLLAENILFVERVRVLLVCLVVVYYGWWLAGFCTELIVHDADAGIAEFASMIAPMNLDGVLVLNYMMSFEHIGSRWWSMVFVAPWAEEVMRNYFWGNCILICYEFIPKMFVWVENPDAHTGISISMLFHLYEYVAQVIGWYIGEDPMVNCASRMIAHYIFNFVMAYNRAPEWSFASAAGMTKAKTSLEKTKRFDAVVWKTNNLTKRRYKVEKKVETRDEVYYNQSMHYVTMKEYNAEIGKIDGVSKISKAQRSALRKLSEGLSNELRREDPAVPHFARPPPSWLGSMIAKRRKISIGGKTCTNLVVGTDSNLSTESVTTETYVNEMFAMPRWGLPDVNIKADDAQFEELMRVIGDISKKGVDLNFKTGLDRVFAPSEAPVGGGPHVSGGIFGFDTNAIIDFLDISPDLSGLAKAILYIVGLSKLKHKVNNQSVTLLCTLAQTGVLYRVFTKFEIYNALDKLMTALSTPTTEEAVTEMSAGDLVSLINGVFLAYFSADAASASSLAELGSKLGKAKTSMTGVQFGLKTVSDYVTYVLNLLLGDENDALVNGDPQMVKCRDMMAQAVRYIKIEGAAAKGMKTLSECKSKLEDYRTTLMKDDKNPNRTVLLSLITEMLRKISVLSDQYDLVAGEGTLSKRIAIFTFQGESRIGKSLCARDFCTEAVSHANRTDPSTWASIMQTPALFVTEVKQGQKYLDLTACTKVIYIDDADVFRKSPGSPMDECSSLIFQCGTDSRPIVDGASIEAKGTKVCAEVIVRCTNVSGEPLKNQAKVEFMYPEAMKNRTEEYHYLAFVCDEYCQDARVTARFRKLDKTKIEGFDRKHSHLRFVKWDQYENVALGPVMNYDQMCQVLRDAMDKREEEFEQRARGYYDSNVERFKRINPDWVPPPFVPPSEQRRALREKYAVTEAAFSTISRGVLSDYEEGTEEWFKDADVHFKQYFNVQADSLASSLIDWAKTAAVGIWGYRRQILGAVTLLASYRVAVFAFESIMGSLTQSGAPKPVRKRSVSSKDGMWSRRDAKSEFTPWAHYNEVGCIGAPTIDVANKLLHNMFKMYVEIPHEDGDITSVPLAYGFQTGKIAFFPSHYMPMIDAYFEEYPKAFLKFSFDSGKSYCVPQSEITNDALFQGTRANSDDDIMSIYIASAPNKKSVVANMMTDAEIAELIRMTRLRVVLGEAFYSHEQKMVYRNLSMVGAVTSTAPKIARDKLEDGSTGENTYTVSRSISTEKVITTNGNCGSLYFTDSKFIGVHVNASPSSSVGLLLAKGDVELHLAYHARNSSGSTVCEEPPVTRAVGEEHFTESQRRNVIGIVDCPITRMTCRTHPSPLAECAKDIGIKGEYEIMDLGLASQQKCIDGRPTHIAPINIERFDAVVAHKLGNICAAMALNGEPNLGKLQVHEVVDGLPDEEITGMSRSSSMGYMGCRPDRFGLPKGITKAQYFGPPLGCRSSKHYPELVSRVESLIESLGQGSVDYEKHPELFVVALPKDEFRKVGKDTRVIYCYTPVLNVVINMYFLRAVTAFKKAGLHTNVAYINPHTQAWELFCHLTGVPQDGPHQAIDLDYSAWDTQLHPVAYAKALRMLAGFNNYQGKDLVVVESLISILTGPVVLVAVNAREAAVMKMHAGLASGSPVTSVGNSLTNDLLLGYGVSCTGDHMDQVTSAELSRIDEIRAVTHGDDLVVVPSQALIDDGFCFSSLAAHMSKLGLRPQPITKDGKIVEYKPLVAESVEDTSCIEFLCRNLVRVDGQLRLANKNETNAKQLLFRSEGYNKLDKREKEARWNEYFVEVSLRGKDYYDKVRASVYPCLFREGLSPICGTGYNICLLHKDGIIDTMLWI
nr:MAG: RNA-dependent RNA polymerase [Crogonang virus 120]